MRRREEDREMADSEGQHIAANAASPSRERLSRDFWVGVAISLILVGLCPVAETTWFGTIINRVGFAIVQRALPSDADPPVVVVDISALPTSGEAVSQGNETFRITDRSLLQDLLTAIIDQHPAVVGVDIDMSSVTGGFLASADSAFFESIDRYARRQRVAIVFGIARRQNMVEQVAARHGLRGSHIAWLGSGRYDRLAASIYLPTKATHSFFSGFVFGNAKLPTLSRKLADAYLRSDAAASLDNVVTGRRWPAFLASTTTLGHEHRGTSIERYLADYSALSAIERSRVITTSPIVLRDQGYRFRDKIVLLGDATTSKTRDHFPLPFPYDIGGAGVIYAGVLFHAVGTYTLVQPLYRLTGLARTVIDLLFAYMVLGVVYAIRRHYVRKTAARVASARLMFFGFAIAAAIVCFGVVVVPYTRLVWEDWLLVVLVLWLHPRIEPVFASGFEAMCRIFPTLRDLAVFRKEEST
jgi:CHASE2 domain-containing sensor protein